MACDCGTGGGNALLSGTLDSRYAQPSVGNVPFAPGAAQTNPLFDMLHHGAFWFVIAVIVGGVWLWDMEHKTKGE